MIKAYYQISRSKNGTRFRKGRIFLSRSFLKQFSVCLVRSFDWGTSYNGYDTGNSLRSAAHSYGQTMAIAAIGGDAKQTFNCGSNSHYQFNAYDFGIILGTGTNVVTPTDFALQTRINHGKVSGSLEYLGTLVSAVVVSAPDAYFTIERIFRNSSGGTIDINEMGLYAVSDEGGYVYCIIRDKLPSPISVEDGEYLKVTYTIKITA